MEATERLPVRPLLEGKSALVKRLLSIAVLFHTVMYVMNFLTFFSGEIYNLIKAQINVTDMAKQTSNSGVDCN